MPSDDQKSAKPGTAKPPSMRLSGNTPAHQAPPTLSQLTEFAVSLSKFERQLLSPTHNPGESVARVASLGSLTDHTSKGGLKKKTQPDESDVPTATVTPFLRKSPPRPSDKE